MVLLISKMRAGAQGSDEEQDDPYQNEKSNS